jgi:hypothetical protein
MPAVSSLHDVLLGTNLLYLPPRITYALMTRSAQCWRNSTLQLYACPSYPNYTDSKQQSTKYHMKDDVWQQCTDSPFFFESHLLPRPLSNTASRTPLDHSVQARWQADIAVPCLRMISQDLFCGGMLVSTALSLPAQSTCSIQYKITV